MLIHNDIMSGQLVVMCHCLLNEAIAMSLRLLPFGRNDRW